MIPEDTQNPGRCMEPLQLAGQIIMENGGETFRAEETICRMGEGLGLHEVESFAVPSGLFISYRAEGEQLETGIKRVHRQSTNLTRVDEVNRVSRQVSAGKMSAQDALTRLRDIARMKGPMAGGLSILSAAVCAGGFALLFGGWLPEVGVSAVVTAIVQAFSLLLLRFHSRGIATNILGGLLTAMLPHLAARLCPGLITEAVIAGALMPLVPGIAMTNAVQDTMRGDMVSGLSHGVEALLTACMIAGGALLSPPLLRLLEGGGF